MFIVKSYKENHPNPMLYRENYMILNGEWDFCFDKNNLGVKRKYFKCFTPEYKINVPYSYLSISSGIHITKRCDHVWYHRTLEINEVKDRYFIHFEGVDQTLTLYINGTLVGSDFGAYHTMSFDITEYLVNGINDITVKVDDSMSLEIPRGKQRFLSKNFMCWYEETTGIYKDVWIENVKDERILSFSFTPSFKNKNVVISGRTTSSGDVKVKVSYKDKLVTEKIIKSDMSFKDTIDVSSEFHPWDVLNPELYDVELYYNEDKVLSYFGIRDIEVKNDKILLNGKELYQKLVLDQGYIEHGDLTLTSKELEEDIKATINLGFNGARKHQKRESTIYYSLADFYGLLVWSEMPSMYLLTKRSKYNFEREWKRIVRDLYNHPSIITLVPFNESWGIFGIDHKCHKTMEFVDYIYKVTKTIDKTRIVETNDGWSHLESDIITIHNYSQDGQSLAKVIDKAINKNYVPFLLGRKLSYSSIENMPILVSEFGGFSRYTDTNESWGYGENYNSDKAYFDKLYDTFSVIKRDKRICGYCYTQLTDVRQEKNGLLTMDRKLKIDYKLMREINK